MRLSLQTGQLIIAKPSKSTKCEAHQKHDRHIRKYAETLALLRSDDFTFKDIERL
jgi:hypothetical protein